MAVRAVSSGGLTWGRGGTEPTRCRCDKQHGRAKCSVGPTRKRQGREIAQGGQGRVLVGGNRGLPVESPPNRASSKQRTVCMASGKYQPKALRLHGGARPEFHQGRGAQATTDPAARRPLASGAGAGAHRAWAQPSLKAKWPRAQTGSSSPASEQHLINDSGGVLSHRPAILPRPPQRPCPQARRYRIQAVALDGRPPWMSGDYKMKLITKKEGTIRANRIAHTPRRHR